MALAREPEIREATRGRRLVRLLWETCGIPDFRKLADDTHTRFCGRVFQHLAQDRQLPVAWIENGINGLARPEGDIDTLMQRLAGVRIWAYVAARTDWVPDAAGWQARTRQVEDLLSDALHERLTARFVDRRAAHLLRRLEESPGEELLSAVTARGEVVVEGHPVGHVAGFAFAPDPAAEGPERRLVLRAARRALRGWMPGRVQAMEAAPDAAFEWTADHRLTWEGVPIARLRAGTAFLRPQVDVFDSEYLDGPRRELVRARLQRWVDGVIERDLAPLFAAEAKAADDSALRGLVHRVAEAGGVLPGASDAPARLRGALKRLGMRAGRFALFMPALLRPQAAARRARLWALQAGMPTPALPAPGLVSLATAPDWPAGFAAALGWVQAGPALIRLDVAERIAAELAWAVRLRPAAVPDRLASRLSVGRAALPAVLYGLGVRLAPGVALPQDSYGPPTPPMMQIRRPPRTAPRPPPAPRPDSPFAALLALRR
jgi:ATP-dependent RNA helicase SUPV3L1/SUV3